MHKLPFLTIALIATITSASAADFHFDTLMTKLAFGSGYKQRGSATHWNLINKELPTAWLWLGELTHSNLFKTVKKKAKAYAKIKSTLGYQELRARSQIFGVWDAYDMQPEAARTKALLLEFLDEPFDSPRFNRNALYASYLIGPKGKRVKFIILDVVGARSTSNLLGDEQWAWLEHEIDNDPSQLVVIASAIPVITSSTQDDTWAAHAADKARLIKLLDGIKAPAVILSGHVHFGETSVMQLPTSKLQLTELTSSGLNNIKRKGGIPANILRVGQPSGGRNFGVLELLWSDAGKSPTTQLRLHQL